MREVSETALTYYGNQIDLAVQPHEELFGAELKMFFDAADSRLYRLGERIGKALTPEPLVEREVVDMLRSMTDDVLHQAGLPDQSEQPVSVVIFKAKLPPSQRKDYDLEIYSIADGIAGFNTSNTPGYGDDNSRRWLVRIDRGTNHGSAFDTKGIVYAKRSFESGPNVQNIDTGYIGDLIRNFHDNHVGPIEFELCPDLGTPMSANPVLSRV